MDHWKRLGVPVLLGAVAAGLNLYSVSRKVQPQALVAVSRHVEPGDTIDKRMLKKIDVCGDHGLAKAALPWDERSILYDWRATRMLRNGDLVLRRDVAPKRNPVDVGDDQLVFPVSVNDIYVPSHIFVGDAISFVLGRSDRAGYRPPHSEDSQLDSQFDKREVGPFRVLAVENELQRDTEVGNSRNVNELTLAVSKDEDGYREMQLLLEAFTSRRVLSIILHGETDEFAADGMDNSTRVTEGV